MECHRGRGLFQLSNLYKSVINVLDLKGESLCKCQVCAFCKEAEGACSGKIKAGWKGPGRDNMP